MLLGTAGSPPGMAGTCLSHGFTQASVWRVSVQFYSDFEAEQPIFPPIYLTSHFPQVPQRSLCKDSGGQDISGALRFPTAAARARRAHPRVGSRGSR